MRYAILTASLALGLAACGGSSGEAKAVIVEACMEDGTSDQKTCDCMATQFVENLDSEMLDLIVKGSQAEDQAAFMNSVSEDLTPAQMASFAGVMISAATECDVEM